MNSAPAATETGAGRPLGDWLCIGAVGLITVFTLVHQLFLSPRNLPAATTQAGPAEVTRFDVIYSHPGFAKVDTFSEAPEECTISSNSGIEVLVAGKLSRPLAEASLVLADGTLVKAESQALGDPKNPVARFRFELSAPHHGVWHYLMRDLEGNETCSGPMLLIITPEVPHKSWPSWPEEAPASPELTVT